MDSTPVTCNLLNVVRVIFLKESKAFSKASQPSLSVLARSSRPLAVFGLDATSSTYLTEF